MSRWDVADSSHCEYRGLAVHSLISVSARAWWNSTAKLTPYYEMNRMGVEEGNNMAQRREEELKRKEINKKGKVEERRGP